MRLWKYFWGIRRSGRCSVLSKFIFRQSLSIETKVGCSELKSQTQDSYSKFPKQLQVSKKDLIACKYDKLIWQLMMARFDYLRINFLLERLSTEKAGASKQKLLEVARETLDLLVFLWLERDRWVNRKHDYDFIVSKKTIVYRQLILLLSLLTLSRRSCLTACLPLEYYVRSS
jgi:hypothetical protein